jgi:hypothetical protein
MTLRPPAFTLLAALLLVACEVKTTTTEPATTQPAPSDPKPDPGTDPEAKPTTPPMVLDASPATPPTPDAAVDATDAERARPCKDGQHKVGESWKQVCNTCSCNEAGEVMCTRMACDAPR